MNNGTGTFSAGANLTPTFGVNPRCVAVADFDNDGDIDLAVGNINNYVNIWLNNGNGTFTATADITTGLSNPVFVAAGDLNGDGTVDLAIVNAGSTTVSVFTNNSAGVFTQAAGSPFLTSSSNAVWVSLEDFDGDGDLDVATVNYAPADISILLNNGSASFPNIAKYSAISASNSLAAGDFDGDGDLDVAVTNSGVGSILVSILKNGVQPTITTLSPPRNAPSSPNASAVSLAYNQSMTTATASVPALNIWGGFSGYKTGGTRSVAGSTVTANVGGFRAGEQVWVTQQSAKSTSFIPAKPFVYGFTAKAGVGPATFVQNQTIPLTNPYGVAFGDIDGDGDLDMATAINAPMNGVAIFLNDGLGNYTQNTVVVTGGVAGTVKCGDINNDGKVDIIVGNGGSIFILTNTSVGMSLSFTQASLPLGGGGVTGITLGDMNADGFMDIIASTDSGTDMYVLYNNGLGVFPSYTSVNVSGGGVIKNGVDVGDIDNDGDLDITVAGQSSNFVYVLFNNGNSTFSAATTYGVPNQPSTLALGDIDGDGDLDLAVLPIGGGLTYLFTNNGFGTYTLSATYTTGGGRNFPILIAFGDVDGDSDLDLVVGNSSSSYVSVLLNSGSGTFTQANGSPFQDGSIFCAIALGDVDGDGDIDVAVASDDLINGQRVVIYKNTTQPILSTFSPTRNTQTLAPNAAINLTYNQPMTTATASVAPFHVWGGMRGFRSGTYSQPTGTASAQLTLSPPLLPNEEVFVSVTNAQNSNAIAARPFSLQYRARSGVAPATFFALPPVAMGSTPALMRNIVTADFNGDGKLDAALSNTGANGVQLMYGNGMGGFTQGPLLGVGGTAPDELVTGDFNNDGRPDIAVSVPGSSLLTVLINTGGAYTSTSYSVASRGLAVADFNGDGALDIAAATPSLTLINIFLGANNGSFTAGTPIGTALPGYRGITTTDVDNDGDMDIIAVSPNSDALVFINTGLGIFDATTLVGTASLEAEYPFAGDFNNDGKMDFVAFSNLPGGALLKLFTGNGAGGFTTTTFGTGISTGFGNVGDLNGDGLLDVAATDASGNAQIWLNTGGAFTQSGIGQGALGAYPLSADVDGDGDLDLMMTDWANGLFKVLLNQPAPVLNANPLTLDFGVVTVGLNASVSAAISGINLVGQTQILLSTNAAFSISSNSTTFATQGTLALTQMPNLNMTLQARFIPLTSGTFTTTITVTSASAAPLTLTLTGVAILPRIPTPPVITALSTNAALIGTPVTVSGLNFTNVSQASIGGISTTVNILSATQANVILPTGLSIGQVVLTNVDGTAISRDSVRALVPYTPPPIITAAQPLVGAAGEIIIVTGANFATGATTVFIGTLQVSTTFNSTTRLTIVLPANALGNLIVRTPNGSTTSSFVLRAIPPPLIQFITPTAAGVGDALTIVGSNFINVLSVTSANMRLDSTSWQIDTLAQRLTVQVVENLNADGTIGTITLLTRSGVAFFTQRYSAGGVPEGVPQPSIIAALPPNSAATLQEGNEISLLATNIPTGATLTLTVNGITATIANIQNTSGTATLRFRLPVGIVPTTLRSTPSLTFSLSIGGIATTATFQLPVQAASLPTLTTFTPPLGGTCSTVSITGQNLGLEPRGRVTNVLVGGVPVQAFRVVSPTQILATLGTVRSGVVTIVTSIGAISTSAMFSFDPNFQCYPPMRREDSLALDAFYVATVGLDWTTSTNWTIQGVPAAMRFGVKVEGDRVTEIRMPKNNVSGSIPDFVMQNLKTLRVLDLNDNRIAGALPQTLSSATNLETLRLGGNRFTGALPPNVAALTRLRQLDLANNLLSDTLGQCWSLTALEHLNLRGNRFTGRISRDVLRLVNLLVLDLGQNQLSETIPIEIGNIRTLQTLRLGGNRFTGSIPSSLGSTTATAKAARLASTPDLSTLDLSNNQLNGTIPAELGVLTNLRELLLGGNALSGDVPNALAGLRLLQTLDVEKNTLQEAPPFIANPRLALRLAGNRMDFATLEAQVPVRPTAGAPQQVLSTPAFSYTPQSPNIRISERTDTSVTLDADLRLRVNARGANNRYAWWKDNVLIQATSPSATLLVPVIAPGDSGLYKCVITNTLLPDLTLITPQLRVTTFTPTLPPQDSIVLIAPAAGAEDVSPVPTFVWTSVSGARQYRLEVSGSPTFTTVLASALVSQGSQTLTSGRVEFSGQGAIGFPLSSSAQIYWRVRAENTQGLGKATSSNFTTASGDALLSAERLDFGRVPRLDTASRLLTIRNISTNTLRIETITLNNPVFRSSLPNTLILAAGRDTTVLMRFIPSALGDTQSNLNVQFRSISSSGVQGALQTQTLPDRLRGRGGALKVIAPTFDSVAVRSTKIASALLINVSGSPLEINSISLLRRTVGFELRSGGIQGDSMAAGATLVLPISCRPEQVGVFMRDTLRIQTSLERIDAPVEAFARARTASDVAVQLGIRAQQENLPPGSTVTLELFVIPTGNITLDSVFRSALPFIQAIVRADKNVLALSPSELSARVQRLDTNRMVRFIVPATVWSGRANVVAQFQCIVVAGNTDNTPLIIEDVQWGAGNVILDTVLNGSFTSRISRAGGKRLISSGTTTQLMAVFPNPAKDEIELTYTLSESGIIAMTLLDARGNEVMNVANEVQSAGKHTMRVKVGWLASGTYHVRLVSPDETATQQVQIVR